MLDQRRLAVLRALVADYVATQEPVGSKGLVERHELGVSPATVRNDLSVLEDQGLVVQPHTSAGRVPTAQGYRVFVDGLSAVKPLTATERKAIGAFLDGAVDLDDVLRRSVRLLAQLTQQVAVVQYPRLQSSRVRHLEVLALGPVRLMVVLIVDTGRVEQRVVELAEPLGDDDAADLRRLSASRISGQRLADAGVALADLADAVAPSVRPAATAVVAALLETLVEAPDERLAVAGTGNLARSPADFPGSVRPVLDALEEQVVLLRLLEEVHDPSTVLVRIGEETGDASLREASVVSTAYGGEAGTALAALGVLGPVRMDYPSTMGAVAAVARYVGRLLAES